MSVGTQIRGSAQTLNLVAGLIRGKMDPRFKPTQISNRQAILLMGHPGIGKTTAVREHLEQKPEGYLFLYVSPRVVINRDVTHTMARKDGEPSGILTITTNAALISSAPRWHLSEVKADRAIRKQVDGAVVVDGLRTLVKPNGAILVISPEEEQEIEAAHAGSRIGKTTISENEDIVNERSMAGVLSSMSTTTRDLLALNPDVNRVVMTAALQGFREKAGGKTTMDALSSLFKSKASDPAGIRERRIFSERIPNIVVMVDELAGDGAGSRAAVVTRALNLYQQQLRGERDARILEETGDYDDFDALVGHSSIEG